MSDERGSVGHSHKLEAYSLVPPARRNQAAIQK